MSGKRPAEDDLPEPKRVKMNLEASNRSNESDNESVHSCQGYNTELANDGSDPSPPSSFPPLVEYDVAEPEVQQLRYYFSDDSIEHDNFPRIDIITAPVENIDVGLLGDTSEENSTSPTSNSDVDPGLPRNDYLDFEKCTLCQTKFKDISYPYCYKCFTWKKNFFPDRPRARKKRGNNYEVHSDAQNEDNTSDLRNKTNCSRLINIGSASQGPSDDSGVGNADAEQSEDLVDGPSQCSQSSQPSTSTQDSSYKQLEMCGVCFLKPKSGVFVHGNHAHMYGCYGCAKEIWYQNGCCPLCRRKASKVIKLFL